MKKLVRTITMFFWWRYVTICFLLCSLFVVYELFTQQEPIKLEYVYEFPNRQTRWPGISLRERVNPCVPKNTLTLYIGGRLGNLILSYASVWSLATLYNLKPVVPEEMITTLEKVFQTLSIPTPEKFFAKESNCTAKQTRFALRRYIGVEEIMDQKVYSLDDIVLNARRTKRMVVLQVYNILVEAIVPLATELRQEFRYKTALVTGAQQVLATVGEWMVSGNKTSDLSRNQVIYVGVHVRRTDYKKHIRYLYEAKDEAGVHYYRRAVQWMRSSLSKDAGREVTVAFVVASDDPVWCQSVLIPSLIGPDQGSRVSDHLGHFGVFWGGQGDITTPEQDLVLLSSCNHSIFAYGTYGIWSALMAGGRTVVYDISGSEGNRHIKGYSPAMQFAQHMNNWVALW